MRSRRLLDASGRSLNFGRRDSKMMRLVYAQFFLVAFWRHRTLATALLALGFLAYVVGQAAGSLVSADVSRTYDAHGAVTSVVENFHGWAWTLSRYAGTVGMWVAALGATMHLFRRGLGRHDAPVSQSTHH